MLYFEIHLLKLTHVYKFKFMMLECSLNAALVIYLPGLHSCIMTTKYI